MELGPEVCLCLSKLALWALPAALSCLSVHMQKSCWSCPIGLVQRSTCEQCTQQKVAKLLQLRGDEEHHTHLLLRVCFYTALGVPIGGTVEQIGSTATQVHLRLCVLHGISVQAIICLQRHSKAEHMPARKTA